MPIGIDLGDREPARAPSAPSMGPEGRRGWPQRQDAEGPPIVSKGALLVRPYGVPWRFSFLLVPSRAARRSAQCT